MEESTLRNTLEALTDKAEAGDPIVMDAPPEAPQIDTPPADTQQGQATETAEQKAGRTAGRPRDEKGRLLPGAPQKAEPVIAQQPPALAPKPLARPSSWKKDFEPHWEKLVNGQPMTLEESRALAEYNLQRESEAAKGVSTYKAEFDQLRPLGEAVAPFMQDMQQHGIEPAKMITQLMTAHKTLALGNGQQKLAMFSKLAQDYGVPLQALYDPQYAQQFVQQTMNIQPPAPPPVDPRQAAREEVEAYFTKQRVSEFAEAKDDAGNLRYPHFETVRQDMALLLDAGKAKTLEEAYRLTVRMNDDLWQQEQQAKAQADAAAKLEAQRAATLTAKRNAISPRSATPASAGAPAKKGLRATLEDAFDEHTAGRV